MRFCLSSGFKGHKYRPKSKVLSACFCLTEVVMFFWNWWDKIDVYKHSGAQRLHLRLQLVESILGLEPSLLHVSWRLVFAGLLAPWLWKRPNPCRWCVVGNPNSACYLQGSDPGGLLQQSTHIATQMVGNLDDVGRTTQIQKVTLGF